MSAKPAEARVVAAAPAPGYDQLQSVMILQKSSDGVTRPSLMPSDASPAARSAASGSSSSDSESTDAPPSGVAGR